MSPLHTTKDPSKMSKGKLLQLYNATAAKKDDLTMKYGQYPLFHDKIGLRLTPLYGKPSLALGKVHKRYKCAKKVLTASQDPNEST